MCANPQARNYTARGDAASQSVSICRSCSRESDLTRGTKTFAIFRILKEMLCFLVSGFASQYPETLQIAKA
jgi:hypothetical protein